MPSCCMDGQFCDFPWCACDGNADFRRRHKLEKPTDTEQDCGEPSCNYCRQVVRRRPGPSALGVGGRDANA